MCMTINASAWTHAKVVKRPIVVWKRLHRIDGEVRPPVYTHKMAYTFGKTATSALLHSTTRKLSICEGLHAYTKRIGHGKVYPAIVPVGARVYFGYGKLATDKLIVFKSWTALLETYPGAQRAGALPKSTFVE